MSQNARRFLGRDSKTRKASCKSDSASAHRCDSNAVVPVAKAALARSTSRSSSESLFSTEQSFSSCSFCCTAGALFVMECLCLRRNVPVLLEAMSSGGLGCFWVRKFYWKQALRELSTNDKISSRRTTSQLQGKRYEQEGRDVRSV